VRSTTPGAALAGGRGYVRQEGYLSRPREPLPTRVQGLPPLPPSAVAALDRGLLDLDLALGPAARTHVVDHVRLLLAWNESINLTAIREPDEIVRLHVLDSLTAVAPLRELGVARLLDLGSGGGFPGLPLAVALPSQATLIDSIGKKVRFLEATTTALDLPGVTALAARAEELAGALGHRERWPAVTARAVSSLPDLVELAFPLLLVGGHLVAWKRGAIEDELAAADRAIAALGGGRMIVREPALQTLPGHRLVLVMKARPTAAGWPRDPATRRRRPW
jgi:16S rRNA (guanine527-N7)-methyltransferase